MLNIMRGTGLDGLCGMSHIQGQIIRPLLNVSKAQIINYLSERKISYRTDSSNNSNEYTRNRVRNVLFPAIRDMFKINPAKQIIKMTKLIQEDRNYLDETAEKAFLSVLVSGSKGIELSVSDLKSLHPALVKRIIRLAWERIIGTRKNLEQVHVEQILNLCHNGHTGKKIHLPLSVEARISYDRLVFSKQGITAHEPFCCKAEKEGPTMVREAKGVLSARVLPAKEAFRQYGNPDTIKEKAFIQLFDFDRLEGDITVRSRMDGDRIRPHGLGGEKKLKEFFIDQKVPQEIRSSIPLLTLGNRVVWIVGMRTSDDFRARDDTRNAWVLSWSDLQDGGEGT
jgi:tRNA(Ile)-lysidine synthase